MIGKNRVCRIRMPPAAASNVAYWLEHPTKAESPVLILAQDDYIDPVRMVTDVLINPVELGLRLFGCEADCHRHSETVDLTDSDDDIAVMG